MSANVSDAVKNDDEEILSRNSRFGNSWTYMCLFPAPGARNTWSRSCTEVIHVKPGAILRTCDVDGRVSDAEPSHPSQ